MSKDKQNKIARFGEGNGTKMAYVQLLRRMACGSYAMMSVISIHNRDVGNDMGRCKG